MVELQRQSARRNGHESPFHCDEKVDDARKYRREKKTGASEDNPRQLLPSER